MFKIVGFWKRKLGMSSEDFKNYYENVHSKLGMTHMPSAARRYVRRYLKPVPGFDQGGTDDFRYDVITELWFDNQADGLAAMSSFSDPEIAAAIATDEERLFDRGKQRIFVVEEYESEIGR